MEVAAPAVDILSQRQESIQHAVRLDEEAVESSRTGVGVVPLKLSGDLVQVYLENNDCRDPKSSAAVQCLVKAAGECGSECGSETCVRETVPAIVEASLEDLPGTPASTAKLAAVAAMRRASWSTIMRWSVRRVRRGSD